jgi:hypothetical protein
LNGKVNSVSEFNENFIETLSYVIQNLFLIKAPLKKRKGILQIKKKRSISLPNKGYLLIKNE